MALVTGNADLVRVGPGKLYVAAIDAVTPPVTLAGAADQAALYTDGYREVGFTTEGSALTYTQTADGVEVAERLRPIKTIITGVEMTFEFTMAQISPENLALAMNAGADSIATTADEITFTWPKSGGVARTSILWVSDDNLEALVLSRCFAGGDITIPRRKGVDAAAVGVTFTVEENPDGDDAWYMVDPDLVA